MKLHNRVKRIEQLVKSQNDTKTAMMTIIWQNGDKTSQQIGGTKDMIIHFNIPRGWAL